jgi:hypothetical protein
MAGELLIDYWPWLRILAGKAAKLRPAANAHARRESLALVHAPQFGEPVHYPSFRPSSRDVWRRIETPRTAKMAVETGGHMDHDATYISWARTRTLPLLISGTWQLKPETLASAWRLIRPRSPTTFGAALQDVHLPANLRYFSRLPASWRSNLDPRNSRVSSLFTPQLTAGAQYIDHKSCMPTCCDSFFHDAVGHLICERFSGRRMISRNRGSLQHALVLALVLGQHSPLASSHQGRKDGELACASLEAVWLYVDREFGERTRE